MSEQKVRYLYESVREDLQRKMVFIGGPRQVGKTYFARHLARREFTDAVYLNWDRAEDRTALIQQKLPRSGLLILDEVHKYRQWRQLVKGMFDHFHPQMKILVSGSARLDYYRYGGDSLQGRYFYHRMHPFSAKELRLENASDLKSLLALGGFPEPFLSGSAKEARRWAKTYRQRLVREDLAQIERSLDLAKIELMTLRLPDLVGSPLSINALREDLQVSHVTCAKWLQILERLYHVFSVHPFGAPKIRAVKKEFKHYHWDWSLVPEPGARFENMIASHLLKWCHFVEDVEGEEMELRYFRDKEQREVDFVVTKNREPILFCEAKINDKKFSPHLRYLKAKFPNVRAIQVVLEPMTPTVTPEGLEMLSAITFLNELPV